MCSVGLPTWADWKPRSPLMLTNCKYQVIFKIRLGSILLIFFWLFECLNPSLTNQWSINFLKFLSECLTTRLSREVDYINWILLGIPYFLLLLISLRSLNILAIRRHIVADIRGAHSDSEDSHLHITSPRPASRPASRHAKKEENVPLSYQKLVSILSCSFSFEWQVQDFSIICLYCIPLLLPI